MLKVVIGAVVDINVVVKALVDVTANIQVVIDLVLKIGLSVLGNIGIGGRTSLLRDNNVTIMTVFI